MGNGMGQRMHGFACWPSAKRTVKPRTLDIVAQIGHRQSFKRIERNSGSAVGIHARNEHKPEMILKSAGQRFNGVPAIVGAGFEHMNPVQYGGYSFQLSAMDTSNDDNNRFRLFVFFRVSGYIACPAGRVIIRFSAKILFFSIKKQRKSPCRRLTA
jgi:hypothetical protein